MFVVGGDLDPATVGSSADFLCDKRQKLWLLESTRQWCVEKDNSKGAWRAIVIWLYRMMPVTSSIWVSCWCLNDDVDIEILEFDCLESHGIKSPWCDVTSRVERSNRFTKCICMKVGTNPWSIQQNLTFHIEVIQNLCSKIFFGTLEHPYVLHMLPLSRLLFFGALVKQMLPSCQNSENRATSRNSTTPPKFKMAPWTMLVGRQSFPLGKVRFSGDMLNFQGLIKACWCDPFGCEPPIFRSLEGNGQRQQHVLEPCWGSHPTGSHWLPVK